MEVAERSTSGEQDGNSAQSPESKVSCRSLAVFIAEEGYAQADGNSKRRSISIKTLDGPILSAIEMLRQLTKAASAAGSPDGIKNTLNDTIWLVKVNLMTAACSGDVQRVRTEVVEARSCFVA